MKTLQISLLILTAGACASALSCEWIGTAPFCRADPTDCVGTYNHYWTWSKCGDGKQCWSRYKVLCCNKPIPYSLLYWKGTSPFCRGSCNDCSTGDDCVINDNKCGDGARCWTGHKVLCGRTQSTSMAELQDLMELSEYTKAKEEENLNMALLMGEPGQVVETEGPDPGLVLAYVNYDKIIMEN